MTLILVATPIGNLSDISQRAIETLKSVDWILCEDTSHSRILCKRYGIETRCVSYHKFNEKKQLAHILQKLREGKQLALISDAGMPAIQDPGQILVDACLEEGISVSAVPGPSSVFVALALSGFPFEKFQFVGFLPKSHRKALLSFLYYPGVTVAFESPKRIKETLKTLLELAPERKLALVKEMTKVHEEVLRGTAQDLLDHFQKKEPLGEMVLVLSQGDPPQEKLSLQEEVALWQEKGGLSLKEALKVVAKRHNVSKSKIYKNLL